MADGKRFYSLTFKLMAVVCLAVALAIVMFISVWHVGGNIVDRVYMSDKAVNTRLEGEIASFRSYVQDNGIASTSVNEVGSWNREHPNVELTIFGINTTISSSGSGASLMGNDSGLVIRAGALAEGAVEYAVNFRDGVFSVAVYDNSAGVYANAVLVAAIIAAALVFLAMLLLYDQHITRIVQTLSRQVRQVSRGDLQMQIKPMSQDEIGLLAQDVETMRLSIIDKLQREEAAWQANTQLITAISHDVRTPLTALVGYLEILSDESIPMEERRAYLEICKNNANRLKSLTDELFGFFLVFGRPNPDQVLEEFDAATLLDQLLLEHEMNLRQYGLTVEGEEDAKIEGKIRVDLGHLRRIFDNLFSNVQKYADRSRPVSIRRMMDGDDLRVVITNYIPEVTNRVESNRIGLKTCEKLTAAMGGEFYQRRDAKTFTVEVVLPLIQEER